MKSKELNAMGIPTGAIREQVLEVFKQQIQTGRVPREVRGELEKVAQAPGQHRQDPVWGGVCQLLDEAPRFQPREAPAEWRQWGRDLDENAVDQMRNACELPVAVRGALMPDAHLGYGLPIGGVLATEEAVIPYAVGVDIACRMKLTVLDLPVDELDRDAGRERLTRALMEETRFGMGASFGRGLQRSHDVLDHDWSVSPVTNRLKSKARDQLGTSGSGNHFVEFGELVLEQSDLGLEAGTYLALLSHSGSRGTGASVAAHYSRLAMERHPELPSRLRHLAWLGMDEEAGQEYWAAMTLMGEYAAANHACIHRHVVQNLGAEVLLDLENHHNFAWKEEHDGREVIVHRKGATPAGSGVLGIIPGSMATPGYVVRGRGDKASLDSASHGAGRVMSRTQAIKQLDWASARRLLESRRVTLISAGLDEVPMVYKDIDEVMAAQADLVEKVARFQPRLVRMAPPGEKAED